MVNSLKYLIILLSLVLIVSSPFTSAEQLQTYSSGWDLITSDRAPDAQAYGAMAYDGTNDLLVLFGGQSQDRLSNATWVYDPKTSSWQELILDGPEGRSGHILEYIPEIDSFLLFGGQDASGASLSDTWLFDSSSLTWKQIDTTTSPILAIGGSSTIHPDHNRLLYFGGRDTTAYSDQLWEFDTDKMDWKQYDLSIRPVARALHAMEYDLHANAVIMYGGENASHEFKDTWMFDIEQYEWIKLDTVNLPHSFGYYSWTTGVSSGIDTTINTTYFVNDFNIWYLDIQHKRWNNVRLESSPTLSQVSTGNQFAFITSQSSFVLFGGVTPVDYLDDFYRASIQEVNGDISDNPTEDDQIMNSPGGEEAASSSSLLIFSQLSLLAISVVVAIYVKNRNLSS